MDKKEKLIKKILVFTIILSAANIILDVIKLVIESKNK